MGSDRRTGPDKPTSPRRSAALAVLSAAAIVMSACGSGAHTPHVANLGTNSAHSQGSEASGRSSTTTPAGNPTRLVDQWATCMRAHGDPNQADPTIDANKVIHITWDGAAVPGGIYGTHKGGQGNLGPGQYCRTYLNAAQQALRGGQQQPHPSQATLLKYSECMRTNGVSDFPDPSGGTLSVSLNAGGDLNPDNPTFKRAQKVCDQQTGLHFGSASARAGTVELNGVAPP